MNHTVNDFEKEITDIQALSRSDVHAFNRLYQRYHKAVHANILKLVKTEHLSAEILQDVFISLWQNRHRINTTKSLGGWLFVVSHNKSLNTLRDSLKESLEYVAEYPESRTFEDYNSEVEAVFEMRMQLLEKVVSELPRRKREVFQLHWFEGRTKEDVANTLGLSPRSVSNYLKDANKLIKDNIVKRDSQYAS